MEDISKWQFEGQAFIWRYKVYSENYFGYHFTADKSGCESLADLCGLFCKSAEPRHRTVEISPPTSDILAIPNYDTKVWAPKKLKLKVLADDSQGSEWLAKAQGELLELQLGKGKLAELKAALEDLPEGAHDYFIGPERDDKKKDEMSLWFWLYPETRIKNPR
jgi:hypothetical protein